MRFGALLNDAQVVGIPPTSVAGGDSADGNWSASVRFCGPGSVRLQGPLALTAPSGGSSGLPKEAAFAVDTVIAAPIADAASRFRLESIIVLLECLMGAPSKRRAESRAGLPRKLGSRLPLSLRKAAAATYPERTTVKRGRSRRLPRIVCAKKKD